MSPRYKHGSFPYNFLQDQLSLQGSFIMDVKTVAVIGAGVSGVSSAIHLRNAGLEVTVYERDDVAGGVW
jgi:NADPH-dependent glutamate synthase beta subunit-like oxidoreductase